MHEITTIAKKLVNLAEKEELCYTRKGKTIEYSDWKKGIFIDCYLSIFQEYDRVQPPETKSVISQSCSCTIIVYDNEGDELSDTSIGHRIEEEVKNIIRI